LNQLNNLIDNSLKISRFAMNSRHQEKFCNETNLDLRNIVNTCIIFPV
jgi:hypothetical protein